VKFNPDQKGTFSKMISGSQKSYCDTIRGQITDLSDIVFDHKKFKHSLKKRC